MPVGGSTQSGFLRAFGWVDQGAEHAVTQTCVFPLTSSVCAIGNRTNRRVVPVIEIAQDLTVVFVNRRLHDN
jgi:hypothetical protein